MVKKVKYNMSVEEPIMQQIKIQAVLENIPVNELLVKAFLEYKEKCEQQIPRPIDDSGTMDDLPF